MSETLRKRFAEIVRAPALFGRVVPELFVARTRGRTLVSLLGQHARKRPDAVALCQGSDELTYRELAERIHARAAWLGRHGIVQDDSLLLVGSSGIEYAALLLACSSVGANVALAGPELSRAFLDHALTLAAPKLVLASSALLPAFGADARVLAYDDEAARAELAVIAPAIGRELAPGSRNFARLFTSGTTGPSKLSNITESYALFASTVFARLVHRMSERDRLYCCLPLYHASGLLLGLGACLVAGAPIVLRERFSASAFFDEVRRTRSTVALYIGEVGRALAAQPVSAQDREHPLRLLVGNGMSYGVWSQLRERYQIPEIAEFYAATEFPGSIVNLTGKLGSVGHVPFERLRGYRLARVSEEGELLRGEHGFASEPRAGEPGELLLRVPAREAADPVRLEGEAARRWVRGVFRRGDCYVRSGDLFRRDADGYFYFVDRLGDAFRFKGELVATVDVEDALERAGVRVSIVGVRVPSVDGKVGLAVAVRGSIDLDALRRALETLPGFARPRFLRLTAEIELGPSLKLKKRVIGHEGVDPEKVKDPLYLIGADACEPLTVALFQRITNGTLRL